MCEPARSGYLNLGDVSLYYRDYNRDAEYTLLLLHGNGGSWRTFEAQLGPYTEAGYRVVTVDSRAQGKSGRGTAPMAPRQLAADMLGALDQLDIARAAVVGFSDGGNIALLMAAACPERLWALVASGANLHPAGVRLTKQMKFEMRYAVDRLAGFLSPARAQRAEVLGLTVDQPKVPFSALRGVQLPALIMGGERDIIRRGHLLQLAAALPKGQAAILPDAPHGLFAPPWAEEANRIVLSFLAGVQPGAAI